MPFILFTCVTPKSLFKLNTILFSAPGWLQLLYSSEKFVSFINTFLIFYPTSQCLLNLPQSLFSERFQLMSNSQCRLNIHFKCMVWSYIMVLFFPFHRLMAFLLSVPSCLQKSATWPWCWKCTLAVCTNDMHINSIVPHKDTQNWPLYTNNAWKAMHS